MPDQEVRTFRAAARENGRRVGLQRRSLASELIGGTSRSAAPQPASHRPHVTVKMREGTLPSEFIERAR